MTPAQEYIHNAPSPYREIMMELQVIIQHHVPDAELRYSWKLPVFYLNGRIFCFFNVYKKYLDVAFCCGNLMTETNHLLINGKKRKRIRSLHFTSLEQIDYDLLKMVIEEAKIVQPLK